MLAWCVSFCALIPARSVGSGFWSAAHAAPAIPAAAAPGGTGSGQSEPDNCLRQLQTPRGVRLRLSDGVPITGVLTAWSDEGLLGSFGYRRWSDLRPTDARDLFLSLVERGDPTVWVRLGAILLTTRGGAGLAEQAFRRARAMDPEVAALIDDARRQVAQRQALDQGPDARRLRLDEPESRAWSGTPWPSLRPAERDVAVEILKEDAAAVLSLAGMTPVRPVESDRLLLYWDAPREQVAQLAINLERTITWIERLLSAGGGSAEQWGGFWGKAVVVVAPDRASFKRLQERVFLQVDKPQRTAMGHCIGAKVVVVGFAGGRGDDQLTRLARELTFGVLHRHISARRLPPWANEGLAEMAAANAAPDHGALHMRRRAALQALRGGLDVATLLSAAYGDPGWPGPLGGAHSDAAPIGPAIGRLALELIFNGRDAALAAWIADVKRGAEWRESLKRHAGVTPAALARRMVERYRHAD